MITPSQLNLQQIFVRYRDYVLSRVSKVRILGETDERELKDVFVELSIVDRRLRPQHADFMGMLDAGMRWRLSPFKDRFEKVTTERSLQPNRTIGRLVKPAELLAPKTRAIISGPPGCGKTTLLKYLTLKILGNEKGLPIWLELKGLNKVLFDHAERVSARNGDPVLLVLSLRHLKTQLLLDGTQIELLREYLLARYKRNEITFLFDGFDELQDQTVENSLNKCVTQFCSGSSGNRLLITTRPYAQHKLGTENLQHFEIEDLDQRQIEAFLNCYYPNDTAKTHLLRTLRDQPSLQDLFRVPLLLGVLLRLHREDRFTDQRMKLFETIVSDLVHELDRSKSVIRQFKISDARLRLDFLRFLAFERLLGDALQEEEKETGRIVFSYELLKDKARIFLERDRSFLNARDLAEDALATALLREVSLDTFAFTHLTLQEYLAAHAFSLFFKKKEYEGLRIICRAYHNPALVEMEVLPMVLGAIGEADNVYNEIERWPESLVFANLRLRTRALAYGARIDQIRLSKLVDRLIEFFLWKVPWETPYRELVIDSLAGINRQCLEFIESKVERFLTVEAPAFFNIAEVLGRIGSRKALKALIQALSVKAVATRKKAAFALGNIGSEEAVDALINALGDHDSDVRFRSAEALIQSNPTKAVDAFIEIMDDQDYLLRRSAMGALIRIGSERVVKALIKALSHKNTDMRWEAAEALGLLGTRQAGDALTASLNDTNRDVRLKAAESLGRLGFETGVDFLISTLRDGDEFSRENGAQALGVIGSQKGAPALIQALKDEDDSVRESAAESLGSICSNETVGPLISALGDRSSRVRVRAAESLLNMGFDDGAYVIISAVKDEDISLRGYAAFVLSKIPSHEAVDALILALDDEFADVRKEAAESLGQIGSARATTALITALSDKDHHARQSAARSLCQIGSPEAVTPLISALQDSDSAMQEAAALALSNMERSVLIPGLRGALQSDVVFARMKAIEVIGYYSTDKTIFDKLEELATSGKSNRIRTAAKEASARFACKLGLAGYSLTQTGTPLLEDNESREGVLVGEVTTAVFQAGHIYREVLKSDWGIDGEIEFKNEHGEASGRRVYLQLKSGDSYLRKRKRDGKEIFSIKSRHAQYWQSHAYPVLLVIRSSSGQTRWMNVTEYLQHHGAGTKQIEFCGEPFTAESVQRMRMKFAR